MTQRILVTAGASGIGLAIAKKFALEGASVHIVDVDGDAVQRAASNLKISGTIADVSDETAVGEAVAEAVAHLGGIDVLVNNAGIAGPTAPVADYPLAAWRQVMDINLTGTFMVTAAAIPHLVRSKAGSIIMMSSLAGRFGYPQRSAYSTSKWGLVGLTKTLAMELGPDNVTCNAILPGAVAGERIEQVLAGRAAVNGTTEEQERASAYRNQSVRRFVEPAEIADLAYFLTGPSARSISGQTFPIDGDSRSSV